MLCTDKFNGEMGREVVKIFKIMKSNPRVFRVELDDGSVLRFETIPLKVLHRIEFQELALLHHHDGMPKIIFYKIIDNIIYKFSEWIYGKIVAEVVDVERVHIKTGEMLAKLNNIQDPKTGLFLTNGEISSTNLIWTKEENIFIIDHDRFTAENENGLDRMVVKNIAKRIQYKDRMHMFLKGYSKYRDIDGVLKCGKKLNWTWGGKKLKNKKM